MPRITDVYAAIPAITGKFELEYEGELKGADNVARELIRGAVSTIYDGWFPNADLRQVTEWFDLGGNLQVDDTLPAGGTARAHRPGRRGCTTPRAPAAGKKPSEPVLASAIDFVLEGLYAQRKISRSTEGQFQAAEQAKRAGAAGGSARRRARAAADRQQEEVLQTDGEPARQATKLDPELVPCRRTVSAVKP